jgi:hypothetical protein
MAYTEATTVANPNGAYSGAVAALAVGNYVRAIATRTGFVRVYDPTLGGTVAASKTSLPQVSAITAKSQFDDAAPWYAQGGGTTNGSGNAGVDVGTAQVGEVIVQLAVPVTDTVDAASVQTFAVDAAALIVISTGT